MLEGVRIAELQDDLPLLEPFVQVTESGARLGFAALGRAHDQLAIELRGRQPIKGAEILAHSLCSAVSCSELGCLHCHLELPHRLGVGGLVARELIRQMVALRRGQGARGLRTLQGLVEVVWRWLLLEHSGREGNDLAGVRELHLVAFR